MPLRPPVRPARAEPLVPCLSTTATTLHLLLQGSTIHPDFGRAVRATVLPSLAKGLKPSVTAPGVVFRVMSKSAVHGTRRSELQLMPEPLKRFVDRLEPGHAVTVLVTYAAILLVLMLTDTGWIVAHGRLVTTDYLGVHAAGLTALAATPAAVYDWTAMHAAHIETLGYDQAHFFPFPYPPPYIAVAETLARLGYVAGALSFILATFAAFALTLRSILVSREATSCVLASPATMANAYVVQNGFLTSALMGGSLLLLRSRPLTAGVLIGLMALKPQLGIVVPFALAAGGHWRAFVAAGLTVLAVSATSLLAWGSEPWIAFLAHMQVILETSGSDANLTRKLQTLFGLLTMLGASPRVALLAQATLGVAAIAAVMLAWRSRISFELKAAALCTASLLASPYLFIYDLTLLVVAMAFFVRHSSARGLRDWELAALVGLNVPLLTATALPVPTGVFCVLGMAMLLGRRLAEDAAFRASLIDIVGAASSARSSLHFAFRPPWRRSHADARAALRARAFVAQPQFRRLPLYCALVIAIFCLSLARNYGAPGGFIRDLDGRPRLNDFAGVWTAGQLVREGQPQGPYSWNTHRAAQERLRGGTDTEFYAWPYPPSYLAVAALLSLMPFGVAMIAWIAATFAGLVAVLARITGNWRGGIMLAAMPVTLLNAFAGQNGFLSATLLGAGLLNLQARPWLGGAMIGLLTYKPHLGLVIPVALLATRAWRAIAGAALSATLFALVSLFLYGRGPWIEFFAQLGRVGSLVGAADWSFKLQSIFGLLRTLGFGTSASLAVHLFAALAMTALLAHIWRRATHYDLKAASLAVACVLASPYVFVYDLSLLLVAQAFLIRYALAHDPQPAEAIGLLAAAGCFALFIALSVPAGLAASLVTGALVVRRIWPEFSLTRPAHAPATA